MSAPLMVHGLVPAGTSPPPDAPAHVQTSGAGLTALLSPGDGLCAPGAGAEAAELEPLLRRHNALLATYAREGDVLPLRFGTFVAGADAAADLLARHGTRLAARLRPLTGRKEYVLRSADIAERPAASPAAAKGGRAYLQARAAARRAAEQAEVERRSGAAAAEAVLAEIADGQVRRVASGGQPGLAALVPQARVDELLARLGDIGVRHPAAALALSGPWPPYSFSGDAVEEVSR